MNAPPVWDVHHHWVNERGYLDRLLRVMDRCGIERVGLIVMEGIAPELFVRHAAADTLADHAALAREVTRRPDRFWGYGFIQPGVHTPADVDRFAAMGLRALKFHLPLKPYGDPDYLPLYARARARRLPCLFHTGIFALPRPIRGPRVCSENCRPIHVEPIALEFPDLPLILAHLGVCWNEEAATLCRLLPNVYADLSGRVDGWRKSLSRADFARLLYWPAAHEKLLFGSDVHADELEQTLRDQRALLRSLGWSKARVQAALRENARRLFG